MPKVRLIDANALLKSETERCKCVPLVCTTALNGMACDCDSLKDVLKRQPTIEPEVRHGRWIPVDGEPYAKCSYCGEKHYGCATPYCDMCGAYMRKEGADNA